MPKCSLFGQSPRCIPSSVSAIARLNSSAARLEATATEAVVTEQDFEAEKATPDIGGETHAYQAEVSRLLDLIVHSLYSHKEVFLRELVSNSSDALDKLRFLSVTEPSLLAADSELAIKIRADREKGILIISDSGIGMTKDDLITSLGTIAQSGTANFLTALKENKGAIGDSNLIGQFGVGFYSAFLVADKVAVSSKSPNSDKQYRWEAESDSSTFVVREETDPEYVLPRGTSVILHLKEDSRTEFLDMSRIQNLVQNYSQFLSFPIYVGHEKTREVEVKDTDGAQEEGMDGEKKEVKKVTKKYYSYEVVNETKPIWMRSTKEVTKEEYLAFYKKSYSEYLEPMAYTHFDTEGEVEFKSLLYIPGMAPFGSDEKQKTIKLYVKRVFISDEFHGELFPKYLSFMRGVVDSNDLPLNVSREILQESRVVNRMKRRLTKKAFDLFDSLARRKDKEDYKKFWKNFGKYIKLGVTEEKDTKSQKRLSNFLRYYSSKHEDEMTSLKQYVDNMKEDQNAIYYFSSETVKSARSAPFLEQLAARDYEVLFLTEPMDEVSINHMKSYEGKDFVDVSKEEVDLGDDDHQQQLANEYSVLCDWMKHVLGEKIAKVEVSKRLSTSPCVLVSGKHGWSANMERIMRAQNLGDTPGLREYMASTRILEINPNHPIIQELDDAQAAGKPGVEDTVDLLYETALMSSGFVPEDPAGFGAKIYRLMATSVGYDMDYSSGGKPITEGSGSTTPSIIEPEVVEPDHMSESGVW